MASVRVGIECFVGVHLLQGFLSISRGRISDLLNHPDDDVLYLYDCRSINLLDDHATPVPLGTVRLQKAQLYLAVPHDAPGEVPMLRTGYVRKRPTLTRLSLGLYEVVGDVNYGPGEIPDPRRLFGHQFRPFTPLTDAQVFFLPNPRWSRKASVVLVSSQLVVWAAHPSRAA